MMKTKTIKTPIVMAEAYGLSCCPSALVPESKLSHRSEEHHGFILKLSHPIGKNHRFAKKPRLSDSRTKNVHAKQYGGNSIHCFLVSVASGVFPLLMSLVAKQHVVMSWLVRELAPRHRAMTSARKLEELKTSAEGFLRFLFTTRDLNIIY